MKVIRQLKIKTASVCTNANHSNQTKGDRLMDGKSRNLVKFFVFALFSVMFILSGCQKEAPFYPSQEGLVTRTSEQLTFLTSKTRRLNKLFTSQQWITVQNGGVVENGDSLSGYSSLTFQPGAVPQDTLIVFEWDSQGYISDLAPHGIVFNHPVVLKLSYKDADLSGVVEDSLKIWYYNEANAIWELVGGEVDKIEKTVMTEIQHFSRYGIAAD